MNTIYFTHGESPEQLNLQPTCYDYTLYCIIQVIGFKFLKNLSLNKKILCDKKAYFILYFHAFYSENRKLVEEQNNKLI